MKTYTKKEVIKNRLSDYEAQFIGWQRVYKVSDLARLGISKPDTEKVYKEWIGGLQGWKR